MTKSKLEDLLLIKIIQAGLPIPVREYRFAPPRKWRADFAYPDHRLLIEVEGGIYTRGRHNRPLGYRDDCIKYNEATLLGWSILRFTDDMIRRGTAARMIAQYLQDKRYE